MLRTAKEIGATNALDHAGAILDKAAVQKVRTDLRQRVRELAEALFQSIRMQHSVKKYHSQRYANLDDIDEPLGDSKSLKKDFAMIRRLGSEQERLARITKITTDCSSRLAASKDKTSTSDWPDWTVEFDKYQRKRSRLFKPYSADQPKR